MGRRESKFRLITPDDVEPWADFMEQLMRDGQGLQPAQLGLVEDVLTGSGHKGDAGYLRQSSCCAACCMHEG